MSSGPKSAFSPGKGRGKGSVPRIRISLVKCAFMRGPFDDTTTRRTPNSE
jgi:hypothetical protein